MYILTKKALDQVYKHAAYPISDEIKQLYDKRCFERVDSCKEKKRRHIYSDASPSVLLSSVDHNGLRVHPDPQGHFCPPRAKCVYMWMIPW
jgi:hypothetical protein